MNATITIICYKSKVLSNGESPLMLRVAKDGKRSMKSLGISINPDFWNFEKSEPKPECPNKTEIEQLILKTKIEYQQKLLSVKVKGENFTAETIVKGKPNKQEKITVHDFYTDTISTLRKNGNIGNSDVYNTSYNSLRNFNKGKNPIYTFDKIDYLFLTKYETWLRKNGNSDRTISNRFKTLRATYNRAITNKVISKDNNPFYEFKLGKFNTKTVKRALSKTDIQKIINYNTRNKSDRRKLAHSIFCFSYLCGGISFVDVANLKSENIKNNRLIYKRQKTNGLINIPFVKAANKYLKRYEQNCKMSSYLFPILDANIHITPVQKNDRVLKVRKQINHELRAIGKELKIKTELTTYVARHSFATVLKNSGVNIALISEALGHSELSTTQIYLDSFENKQFNEAMKHLL
nr:site-specific integrase [uncultured Draconibacterium sp.]